MLILRRKKNESILIGNDIRVTVSECSSNWVRLAIEAPKQISIVREELSEAAEINREALAPKASSVRSLQAALKQHFSKLSDE